MPRQRALTTRGFMMVIYWTAALLAVVAADSSCTVFKDADINPHTAGIGHVAATSIDKCCAICRSTEWWQKGCRFSTLSRGICWLKTDNKTVAHSPGKLSVGCTSEAPPPPAPPPPPPLPPKGTTGPWKKLGPWNIGDDIHNNGEAGTLADAASPAANPDLIYAGGQNNGASSGVLKSVDGGRHWVPKSKGMFVTRVEGLFIADGVGQHVYCAVRGGIYESHDYAESWTLVNGSGAFGTCNTFKNGTINGEVHVMAGCSVGVANLPTKLAVADPASRAKMVSASASAASMSAPNAWPAGWEVIGPGNMARGYITVSDANAGARAGGSGGPGNAVVGICMGHVWVGQVLNRTHANWTTYPEQTCSMMALDPNDASHLIYTKPPVIRQSWDSGQTFESLNHSNIFHCGIDRQGWLYTAAMGGAFFAKPCGRGVECKWQRYTSFRHQRRTNRTVARSTHDYQRIALDFGADFGVSFPSDQGLFVKPPGNATTFITANGNMSNNIAMKVAVSAGEGPEKRYLVTTAWDWAPLASWDGGAHWPSWQAPLDGASATCIGEGGGAYAMGRSNHTLVMHRHNILHSSMGGKNLSRFVPPHRPTVFGPAYATRLGSRSEPNGVVYAPLFMAPMPWNETADKVVVCDDAAERGDLGLHTNFSCLAAVDLGVSYGWYKDINYAVWRGHTDKHCHICKLAGNASEWKYVAAPGAWSYELKTAQAARERARMLKLYDADGDGRISQADLRVTQDMPPEDGDDDEDTREPSPFDPMSELWRRSNRIEVHGANNYIIKNFNYGAGNWTWSRLPVHVGRFDGFVTDPSDGGKAVYGIGRNCIAMSVDQGDSWGPCWNVSGTENNIKTLVIKDSTTMIILRNTDVPLRTTDGGATWQPLTSCARVGKMIHLLAYSWTGKTLALFANGGDASASHGHTAYVWRSTDDGDTWTDETGDIVTNGASIGQWYEETLYLNSGGEGIMSKVFE